VAAGTIGGCPCRDAGGANETEKRKQGPPRTEIAPPWGTHRPRPQLPTVKISEAELHRAVADLLDVVLLPPAVWTTFPAGWGKLSKATAGRLRGSGLKAGFPDILIFFNSFTTGIELKAPGGKLSLAQKAMFPALEAAGVRVYVCHSVDEVLDILQFLCFPVRNLEIAA
jgi:hypothetical protein